MEGSVRTLQHRVNHLEGLVNLLSHFGTCQDNLAADEDQKHNLGLNHAVDETREQLRLVGAEVVMARSQTFETNGEFDVARTDNVLDLEIRELGIETELLNDARIFPRGKLRVILGLGTGHDHLARGKDKSGGLGLADAHDDGGETLHELALKHPLGLSALPYLGVVLGVSRV